MADGEEAPEDVIWAGPDPREWPLHAPGLWDLVLDLESIGRALAVLNGPVPPGTVRPHTEATRFLRDSASQLRLLLSQEVLHAYGLPESTDEESSPYDGGGKARAFGNDRTANTPET